MRLWRIRLGDYIIIPPMRRRRIRLHEAAIGFADTPL